MDPLLLLLLAENADANALSGGAGWVGTGLLGSVLAWLLWVHLPAKDKQAKEVAEAHAAEIKEHRTEFLAALKEQQAAHMVASDKAETRWQRVTDEICTRLERIEEQATSGFFARSEEQLEMYRAALAKKQGVKP